MLYLLDTDMCIAIIKKKPAQVLQKLTQQDISHVAISSITLSELEYGVEKSLYREQGKMALVEFLAPLTILPYDDGAAPFYGRIRAFLEKQGRMIGPLDMLIGAQALSIKATLVTNNKREFERIPGLKVENWV